MINVQLTKEMREQYDALTDGYEDGSIPPKHEIAGVCKGCGRRIPWGYLFVVSKWKVVLSGTMKMSVPEELWCRRGCLIPGSSQTVTRNTREKRVRTAEADKQDDLESKLLAAMTVGQPYKSSEIAGAAKVEDSGFVMKALSRLQSQGKIKFAEGRWKRL